MAVSGKRVTIPCVGLKPASLPDTRLDRVNASQKSW
jgi:hypothetical protein